MLKMYCLLLLLSLQLLLLIIKIVLTSLSSLGTHSWYHVALTTIVNEEWRHIAELYGRSQGQE